MLQSQVIDNLGSDAAVEKDNADRRYVCFSMAHKEFGKDRNGQMMARTVWLQIRWYGYTEKMLACLKKGTKVFVSGRTSVKAYLDNSGNPQPSLSIYATELELCGAKLDGAND